MTLRQFAYLIARLLGDYNAIQRGRVPQRIVRKAAYRQFSRSMNRWLK